MVRTCWAILQAGLSCFFKFRTFTVSLEGFFSLYCDKYYNHFINIII